jgi:hypothetical protein
MSSFLCKSFPIWEVPHRSIRTSAFIRRNEESKRWAAVHALEDRDGGTGAERLGDAKARRADRPGNGSEGTSTRNARKKTSSTNGDKRMEFVNRDFSAAINIRRCAVLKTRPEELTPSNVVGPPLKVKVYEEKLKSIACNRSKKAGRRL